MSNVIAFSTPASRATRPRRRRPRPGPETSATAGCAAASASVATPPEERITSGSGSPALAAGVAERLEVPRDHRPEVGVDRRRRGPLVLAELGRDLVRGDDVRAGQPPPQLLGHRPLVRGVAEREEQADRDRLARSSSSGSESSSSGSSTPSGPIRSRTPWQRSSGTSGSGCACAEPVEMRAVLAAQVQQVLEAGGRDERRARALALEQRVRRDRRPVREPLDLAAPTAAAAASTDSSCRAAVGTFAVRSSPSASSTASVKVPPTSTPRMDTARPSQGQRPAAARFVATALRRSLPSGSPHPRLGWRRDELEVASAYVDAGRPSRSGAV